LVLYLDRTYLRDHGLLLRSLRGDGRDIVH
jgi:hypothetical protein